MTDRLIESIDDICKKPSFTVLRADVKTSPLFGTLYASVRIYEYEDFIEIYLT